MIIEESGREIVRFKLTQAQESFHDARWLLSDGADLTYIVNSLYYSFYYPLIGLLQARGIAAAIQSVSIAQFEKEYGTTGLLEQRSLGAIRKAFDLKPKCSGVAPTVSDRNEVEVLLVRPSCSWPQFPGRRKVLIAHPAAL